MISIQRSYQVIGLSIFLLAQALCVSAQQRMGELCIEGGVCNCLSRSIGERNERGTLYTLLDGYQSPQAGDVIRQTLNGVERRYRPCANYSMRIGGELGIEGGIATLTDGSTLPFVVDLTLQDDYRFESGTLLALLLYQRPGDGHIVFYNGPASSLEFSAYSDNEARAQDTLPAFVGVNRACLISLEARVLSSTNGDERATSCQPLPDDVSWPVKVDVIAAPATRGRLP